MTANVGNPIKPEVRDGVVDYTKCGIHRHPGGRGPCHQCKRETGAWCPHCGTFSCAINIGCLGAHNAVCQSIKDQKLGRVA